MLDKIVLGRYVYKDSFIHRINSTVKILISLFFIFDIFYIKDLKNFLPYIVFILFMLFSSKLKFRNLATGIKPFLFLIIITFFLHIFLSNDKITIPIWKFNIPRDGLINATFISTRLLLIIVFMSFLTLTTTSMQLAEGFETVLTPLKLLHFPVTEMSIMMSISLRFIPTVLEETQKIIKAQKSRGVNFEQGSFMSRLKNYLSILIPLLHNTFTRSEELANALEVRCFNSSVKRTKLHPTSFSYRDFIFITLYFFCFIIKFIV